MQGFHTGPLRADLVGRRSQFALIPLVEGVVGVVARVFALKLELLLIAEMLADIAVQKLHGFIDLGASGPLGTGVQQGVDGVKELSVLTVNQLVAGQQVLSQFITHRYNLPFQ